MRYLLLFSLMLCSLAFMSSHPAFAKDDVCTESFGVLHCGVGEVDHIYHLGNVVLAGTHVGQSLSVTGDVQADNAEIGTMNITGNVRASHLTVHNVSRSTGIFHIDNSEFDSAITITGNVQGSHDVFNSNVTMIGDIDLTSESFKGVSVMTGKFSAESSTFDSAMTLNACLATFSQSKTAQIEMTKQQDCPDDAEKLYLKDKTVVNGNISFPGGNGQVYLSKNSVIRGQVSGGVVIR